MFLFWLNLLLLLFLSITTWKLVEQIELNINNNIIILALGNSPQKLNKQTWKYLSHKSKNEIRKRVFFKCFEKVSEPMEPNG